MLQPGEFRAPALPLHEAASLPPWRGKAGQDHMLNFFRKTDGLATIEWVSIAAVMVLAAVSIASFVMQGTDVASNHVKTGLLQMDASNPPSAGVFGNGAADPIN